MACWDQLADRRCALICLLCMLARLCNVLFVHVHVHVLFSVFVYHLSRQYWLDAHYCNNDFLPYHSSVVRDAVF